MAKRKPVKGYGRYTTDGVSVFRGRYKQRLFKDGYHLVKSGATTFDVVPVDEALGKAKKKATKADKSGSRSKGKRSSKD